MQRYITNGHMKLSAIILAKTDSDSNFEMTMHCIRTLLDSESDAQVIVVESNKKIGQTAWRYPDSVCFLVPPDDFNFHKFLNIGREQATGDFIALLNNDLVFDKNWFSEILKVARKRCDILSFSPAADPYKTYDTQYAVGYKVRTHVNGWCIVAHRKVFGKIGKLDETFDFNYADNDYAMTLKKYNIRHAVVFNSKVIHLENERDYKGEWYETQRKTANIDALQLPEYLRAQQYTKLLLDPKSVKDNLKFHNKWGTPKKLYRKNKVADILIKYHLGFLNRIVMSL